MLNSVGSVAPTEYETQPPVQPTDAPPAPTDAPPIGVTLLGDADEDGDVGILDVTYIQRYEASISLPSPLNALNADVDGDEEVTIIDATLIQRFIAGIISKFPAES